MKIFSIKIIKIVFLLVIIFDWDDTLFFTTELTNNENLKYFFDNNFNSDPFNEDQIIINKIDNLIFDILNKSMDLGNLFIVSNAKYEWIQITCKLFWPKSFKLLNLKKINIISSRDEYENYYPTNIKLWKYYAFNSISKLFNYEKLTNIICIGDSNFEIKAGKKMKQLFKKSFLKSIKFKNKPTIYELYNELLFLFQNLININNECTNNYIKLS